MPSTATDTRAETSAATDKPARKSAERNVVSGGHPVGKALKNEGAGEDIRIIDVGHDETAARAFQES